MRIQRQFWRGSVMAVLFSLAVLATAGCGQKKMVDTTRKIREQMASGHYDAALAILRKSKKTGYDEQDRVVYWMQEGMLLHLTGQYKESSRVLSQAERRTKELYTKSISKGIKAAFVSNMVKDYPGEDYENVLVNVIKALNYLGLGDLSGAMVEARKINEKLKLYNTRYEHKNVYNQDAFAHWLMGMLYEMEGSFDDARIAFEKALEVYRDEFAREYGTPPPPYLGEDYARAARRANDSDALARAREEFGPEAGHTAELLQDHGEIVLVHLNGEGPTKGDFFINCYFRDAARWFCDAEPGGEFFTPKRITVSDRGTELKVAFPQLFTHPPQNPYVELQVGQESDRSQVALPISRIAEKTLRDKMHRIWRDAVIRAVTKVLTSKGAGAVTKGISQAASGGDKRTGNFFGWLAEKGTSAVMQATEEADKRAWTTLPSRIDVARVFVRPGTHTVRVIRPRGGAGGRTVIKGVKVEAGKRVFITVRSLP